MYIFRLLPRICHGLRVFHLLQTMKSLVRVQTHTVVSSILACLLSPHSIANILKTITNYEQMIYIGAFYVFVYYFVISFEHQRWNSPILYNLRNTRRVTDNEIKAVVFDMIGRQKVILNGYLLMNIHISGFEYSQHDQKYLWDKMYI